MKYLCIVLYLHISFKECTIDINMKELVYIADHLTAAECRRLFASLYFESHDLSAALSEATRQVPKKIPCLKLLVKWNSGVEEWEGEGKTHAILERRLRQLNKTELADWLGSMVFHQLAKAVNSSLEDEPKLGDDKSGIPLKVFKDSESKYNVEPWTKIDSILSVTLCGMLFVTLAAFCRMLKLTFRRVKVKHKSSEQPEELIDLMSAESVESDQETIYELDVENRKRISFEGDPKKVDKRVGSGK